MANLCECCGNKNNSFVGDPLYLEENKILCYKCAKPIRDELNQLFYIETKGEFDTLTKSVIEKCEILYNDSVTYYICLLINKRCKNLGFSVGINESKRTPSVNIGNIENTTIANDSDATGMFGSIGEKIKTLAQVVTWIGIIGSIICGMLIMSLDDSLIFSGLLTMVLGSLFSWISSFVLYGFGQLVDNSDQVVRLLKK